MRTDDPNGHITAFHSLILLEAISGDRSAMTAAEDDGTRWLLRARTLAPFAVDAAAWTLGLLGAVLTRYELHLTSAQAAGAVAVVLLAVCVHGALAYARLLYRGGYGSGSFDEVRAVAATVLLTAVVVFAADLPWQP